MAERVEWLKGSRRGFEGSREEIEDSSDWKITD
jgi:hypothetical protein